MKKLIKSKKVSNGSLVRLHGNKLVICYGGWRMKFKPIGVYQQSHTETRMVLRMNGETHTIKTEIPEGVLLQGINLPMEIKRRNNDSKRRG